jgi:SAM-dependent methyltransferase
VGYFAWSYKWWRRALTLPHVVRLSRRAPRAVTDSWDHFWAAVSTTGNGGDVLWDASDPREARHYLDLLTTHADLRLPIVDIGCGNGRFTRALATRFRTALGVDISPAAVVRARSETATSTDSTPSAITFRPLDITEPGAGNTMRAEVGGDANVFVRGVFHVLDASARREAASSIAAVVGEHGMVLIAETNHRGHRLGYLESLGAGPRGIPPALARAIASGIPAPLAFGQAELDDCFPPQRWRRVVSDATATITTIPSNKPGVQDALPGFVAVLARRPGTAATDG